MNVMVSYRSAEYAFVEKLAQYLRLRGINPWIDRQDISPGTKWRQALIDQLHTCDACLVVLSPGYLASEHCRMEVFIARSFGRRIVPIMVEDCFAGLREHEETKGLEDIFMMRMNRLNAVGLPISADEAFRRVADGILARQDSGSERPPIYVSYSTPDGEFATTLARVLEQSDIATWIATTDIRVGENWRDAQARAMLRSAAHLVVLDESMVEQRVLRTEIVLAEARGLETFTVLPARLHGNAERIERLMRTLNSSDLTYRRLAATQYFSGADHLDVLATRLSPPLRGQMVSAILVPAAAQQLLFKLADGKTRKFVGSKQVRESLRQLRKLGLVVNQDGHELKELRSSTTSDLAEVVALTDLGQEWVRRMRAKPSR